ncbi:MAG TPA: hypothetical protein VGN72_07700 [Tepidisphaeraceae bacterium]|jgi:integrase|nr:hypothetical protein [Tepidisphaeraceae bacterium]
MPKLSPGKVPKYRLHKQSGRGIVTIHGKDKLLPGKYGSPESRREWARLTTEWLAREGMPPAPENGRTESEPLTVARLVVQFWRHAKTYYRGTNGGISHEAYHYRDALRPVVRLYGATPANNFQGPALEAVQREMIRLGWCRNYVNRQVSRVRHVFTWALAKGVVNADVVVALRAVTGLKKGRSGARESGKVKPVADAHIAAVLSHLSPTVRAMVELQSITGMRPGELCDLRGVDLDMSRTPWTYRPSTHKTAYMDKDRSIDLGPRARAIIEPFLRADVNAHIFNPADAAAEGRRRRGETRKTPASCGNAPGTNRKRRPKRRPGHRFDVHAYRRAIARACETAFPLPSTLGPRSGESRLAWRERLTPAEQAAVKAWRREHHFHPHRLRHSAATRWRADHGPDAALVLLGDSSTRMIDVYAEKDRRLSSSIMEKIG